MNRAKNVLVLACVTGLLAGCARVSADADGISLRHAATTDLGILAEAMEHCAKFGKTALKVQRSPVEAPYFFRSVVTTFRCVPDE